MHIYQISGVNIVYEVFDGEIVAVNLDSGKYYSLRGTSAFVWAALLKDQSVEQIAEVLSANYELDRALVADELASFVDQLVQENILVANAKPGANDSFEDKPTGDYVKPNFDVYSDMQEILLLDPVHDVDETGWPVAKPGV
jgi:hypothetical protein